MIQGGDPSGTGSGGESYWGKSFEDETVSTLVFNGRGLLAMANRGPNTNNSQFFITFKACPHLDMKHTIFGKLVGGDDVLTKFEYTQTQNDSPLTPIMIKSVTIHVDSFDLLLNKDKILAQERQDKKIKRDRKEQLLKLSLGTVDERDAIGKYMNMDSLNSKKGGDPKANSGAIVSTEGSIKRKKPSG